MVLRPLVRVPHGPHVRLRRQVPAQEGQDRREKGASAAHNTPLEIAWTVIPTLFLVYIFFKGFWTYFDKVMSPGTAIQMDVVAKKWNFRLYYPNGSETTTTTVIGSADIPVFYVPAETPIKLRMISEDVNHSFFVP